MNNPVQILQEEHKLLLSAIDTARHIQEIDDNELYHKLVHDVILFFRNFTEICHFPKESQVLYPILRDKLDDDGARRLDSIQNEHEDMELLIAEIIDAFVSYDNRTVRVALQHYTDELSRIIAKEEQWVLPLAEQTLTAAESAAIFEEFTRLDKKDGVIVTVRNGYYKVMEQLA